MERRVEGEAEVRGWSCAQRGIELAPIWMSPHRHVSGREWFVQGPVDFEGEEVSRCLRAVEDSSWALVVGSLFVSPPGPASILQAMFRVEGKGEVWSGRQRVPETPIDQSATGMGTGLEAAIGRG